MRDLVRRSVAIFSIIVAGIGSTSPALAQDPGTRPSTVADEQAPAVPASSERPAINWLNRWTEDWSFLADPAQRTDPFDRVKYLPFDDTGERYVSLGATIRERYEDVSLNIGTIEPDAYVISRIQLHADVHLAPEVSFFVQVVNALAPGKRNVFVTDRNRLDLEQAFVTIAPPIGEGELWFQIGRQEIAFELQRFLGIRDGANVRRPFDAIRANYRDGPWEVNAFVSRPVTTRQGVFDDVSGPEVTFHGVRVERQEIARGKLAFYYARYHDENGSYLPVRGEEDRDVFDLRYAGRADGWDWDVEGMVQRGRVGPQRIRAWAAGAIVGHQWPRPDFWRPRLALQVDLSSGDRDLDDDKLGTFNPLFPNGYYVTLSNFPGYSNFVQVKPSLTLYPTRSITLLAAASSLWRFTKRDAVYLFPAAPIPSTAGEGSHHTATYGQFRIDWAFDPHAKLALEIERFDLADALIERGFESGGYVGLELHFGF